MKRDRREHNRACQHVNATCAKARSKRHTTTGAHVPKTGDQPVTAGGRGAGAVREGGTMAQSRWTGICPFANAGTPGEGDTGYTRWSQWTEAHRPAVDRLGGGAEVHGGQERSNITAPFHQRSCLTIRCAVLWRGQSANLPDGISGCLVVWSLLQLGQGAKRCRPKVRSAQRQIWQPISQQPHPSPYDEASSGVGGFSYG